MENIPYQLDTGGKWFYISEKLDIFALGRDGMIDNERLQLARCRSPSCGPARETADSADNRLPDPRQNNVGEGVIVLPLQDPIVVFRFLFLLSTAGMHAGCSYQADSSTSSMGDDVAARIRIDGITVLFPSSSGEMDLRRENDVSILTWGDHTIELENRKLTIDGEFYGILDDGQVVAFRKDGTISLDREPGIPVQASSIVFDDVRFALEGQHGDVTQENGANKFIDMRGREFELNDGQFTVDGQSYGRLEQGDEVTVALDGSIAVNGDLREPK